MSVCARCGARALDHCHYCGEALCSRHVDRGCCGLAPAELSEYVEQAEEEQEEESVEASVTARSA